MRVKFVSALMWARMTAVGPLPVIDGLLAATAAVNNWTLVSRDTTDVQCSGIPVLNPFKPS